MDYIPYAVVYTVVSAFGLFLGMLLLLEVGRRIGVRRRAKEAEGASAGVGSVEGAVFGLLGLLMAFTFSGAAARFDTRRQLIVEETNAIGTAYLRLDLLPDSAQPALRERFRQYVDARLEVYRKTAGHCAAQAEVTRANAVAEGHLAPGGRGLPGGRSCKHATMLLLPALNAMIDITTTRTLATQMHPPMIIFVMLFGLALASSLLAGYGMAGSQSRTWLHMLGFAAIIALSGVCHSRPGVPALGVDPGSTPSTRR